MTEKNKIIFLRNSFGGRSALYLNDKLVVQNNPMPIFEVAETMHNNQPFSYEELEVDGEWIDEVGCYPNKFSDIPANVFSE